MREVRVFLSPGLVNEPQLKDSACVVVDILRATSCWVTAFSNGVKSIRPVSKLKECQQLGHKGYLTAAERSGRKVEGFDLGNSPFEYSKENVSGKQIAVTTTNGSLAVQKAKMAKEVFIGSYLNINTVFSTVKEREIVSILCAGWENKPGLEDIIFAGELVSMLSNTHVTSDDSPLIAFELYKKAKTNLMFFLSQADHVKRLLRMRLRKDIEFCIQKNTCTVLPTVKKDEIVLSS